MRLLETEHDVPFDPAALQTARTLRDITQADLALKVGLSRQQINKLERGEVKNPPGLTVHALAAALLGAGRLPREAAR
jgi:transcriptional regulator with XRE-family HTH domain